MVYPGVASRQLALSEMRLRYQNPVPLHCRSTVPSGGRPRGRVSCVDAYKARVPAPDGRLQCEGIAMAQADDDPLVAKRVRALIFPTGEVERTRTSAAVGGLEPG